MVSFQPETEIKLPVKFGVKASGSFCESPKWPDFEERVNERPRTAVTIGSPDP
jgi:hypothetical protein